MDTVEESPPGDDEVNIFLVDNIENQIAAKTIVFSMLQKSIHPEFNNHMIPTIVISSTKIRILMYDAENDILLRSNAIDVFLDIPDEPPQLSPECIIILWMVLHYTIFCAGINTENLTIDLNKIKSGFTDSITDCDDIYRFLLKSGVETFPKVKLKQVLDDVAILKIRSIQETSSNFSFI